MRPMRPMRALRSMCVLGAVTACGGETSRSPDAAIAPDAPADAPPSECSYSEAADTSNDPAGDPASNPMAEPTRLEIGTEPRTLCGRIQPGHFHVDTGTIDADAYRVTTAGTADLVVRFAHSGPADVAFSVFVFDTEQNPALLFGGSTNTVVPDHGAFLGSLPAGTYDVVVSAHGAADLAAASDYKLQIAPDAASRCPAVTATAAYTEADAAGAGNDVIAVDFDAEPHFQLTPADDAAEPTGLTIDTATAIRITGTSGDDDAADDYMDRDTYLVRTAAATRELTLRLRWADEHADLNYIVFPADQTDEAGDSLRFDGTEEYNVVAVKPDSAYWIWVGGHDGSTGLPATYDLSICGEAFSMTGMR